MIAEVTLRQWNSGNTYGTAEGFHVEVVVGSCTMATNTFADQNDALNAGFRTLADMLGEGW